MKYYYAEKFNMVVISRYRLFNYEKFIKQHNKYETVKIFPMKYCKEINEIEFQTIYLSEQEDFYIFELPPSEALCCIHENCLTYIKKKGNENEKIYI